MDPLRFAQPSEWPSDGRDYTAQRYSPLTQIDAANVGQLGLAWFDPYDTFRGVEATPIYADGVLANHMQFQPIPDVSPDGRTGWIRSRAFVMSSGGWGLPLYENEYRKENGVWKISRLSGPFTMYTNWEGWGKNALNNTWPDKFEPAPDLPPSTVYLTYPAYYIVPFHYPHPVTGKVFAPGTQPAGAYHRPPGSAEQQQAETVGRLADGSQPIAEPPRD